MIELEFRTDDAAVLAMFDRFRDATSPARIGRWLQVEAVQILQNAAADRFDSEGDSASGKWAPLAPATNNIRAFYGFGPAHPINNRTGGLRQWVTKNQGDVAVGPTSILRWPDKPPRDDGLARKLATAQEGGGRNKLGLRAGPARPVIAADETDATEIFASFRQHIFSEMGTNF